MKTTHVHSCKKRCVKGGGAWGRRRSPTPELADELSDKLLSTFWLLDDWGSNIRNNFFDSHYCESKSVRLKDKKHSKKILLFFK